MSGDRLEHLTYLSLLVCYPVSRLSFLHVSKCCLVSISIAIFYVIISLFRSKMLHSNIRIMTASLCIVESFPITPLSCFLITCSQSTDAVEPLKQATDYCISVTRKMAVPAHQL